MYESMKFTKLYNYLHLNAGSAPGSASSLAPSCSYKSYTARYTFSSCLIVLTHKTNTTIPHTTLHSTQHTNYKL